MTITQHATSARTPLPAPVGELLFFISLALDLPPAAGYHYDRERAALLERRARAVHDIAQQALMPDADMAALARAAHDIADAHPIDYPVRCGDCGRLPCRCPHTAP